MKEQLRILLTQLLESEEKQKDKQLCAAIFDFLSTKMDLDVTQRDNIKTKHSVALNAYDSARCIKFPVRTKKSLLTILKELQKGSQHILYVGPGPFAPYFLFPIVLGYTATFTFLEINTYSVQVLKEVIAKFGLENSVAEVIQGDATIWQAKDTYDVVLCETSDVGLRREDTLPIYKNLYPQLPHATFMPKDILILAGSGKDVKHTIEFDSLTQAIKRGFLNSKHPFEKSERPFIQNKIILDDELSIEPWESKVTMPLFI